MSFVVRYWLLFLHLSASLIIAFSGATLYSDEPVNAKVFPIAPQKDIGAYKSFVSIYERNGIITIN